MKAKETMYMNTFWKGLRYIKILSIMNAMITSVSVAMPSIPPCSCDWVNYSLVISYTNISY